MRAIAVFILAAVAAGAELPVTKVILYKNGVAYFERSGQTAAGAPARLEFKLSEMDDVLKSLVVEDRGGAVARIRYETNEPIAKRLAELGISLQSQQPLALLLDQWRGEKVEMTYRGEKLSAAILAGRLAPMPNQGQRQELSVVLDSGELRTLDLEAAAGIRLVDPRLNKQLTDALLALSQSRSREKRAVFIDSTGTGARSIVARYLVPAPLWRSTYRLSLGEAGEAMLEGWAKVDNSSGEDWSNVELAVVSGRPVSFISKLYEPKYIQRIEASLPEEAAVRPELYQTAMERDAAAAVGEAKKRVSAPASRMMLGGREESREMIAAAPPAPMMMSHVAETAQAAEKGDLFEYRFPSKVTARNGESILLPFLQQKLPARKLLIYSDRSSANPRNAVEINNASGKTLDGGPITVYDAGGYAGEALVETTKDGVKRMISYAVDQGTRVTTNFESGTQVIRTIKAQRGILTTRTAVETTTTYTADNSDNKEKSLLIEHAVDRNMKLLAPKPDETTLSHYRFAVKLAPKAQAKLAVKQEQELESSIAVTDLDNETLITYARNKSITAAARQQLEAILAKKRELAAAQSEQKRLEKQRNDAAQQQSRTRENISALNRVAGQQEQVQKFAAELVKIDTEIGNLTVRINELTKAAQQMDAELKSLIEKLEF
ncbi:MAG: DUF4139 domain-containing protein [Bryobacteraceae bacterium]|nr:DUF4139 domain-containing protein [Bryobacteraceae bacterium]